MKKVCVIGGGASGLMAACIAAENGNDVSLIEKNEKLGKKIYITGKGRCNLTNDVLPTDFLQKVVRGKKFMYGAIYAFTPQDCMAFFSERGLSLKTERGGRVFPTSDHASDVTKTLERACKNAGVKIFLNETVVDLLVKPYDANAENGEIKPREDERLANESGKKGKSSSSDKAIERQVAGVKTDKRELLCDTVIVCTGGKSYPTTGSTGDGYVFAQKLGLKTVELRPGLCGIDLKGDFYKPLQGLALKNVSISACVRGKKVYDEFGETLFTHFGISGPIVLSLSSLINRENLKDVTLSLDLKPALNEETLDKRLLRLFDEFKNKTVANAAVDLLPQRLVGAVLAVARLSAEKRCNSVTKEERARLIAALKSFPMTPVALRGFNEAIITSGGVDLSEINPKTMDVKRVKGLKICGETLDLDAFTGGYNLQIAFSTGYLAGKNV